MLADPAWVVGQIAGGMSTPVYAYAENNPVMFTDPTRLDVMNESDRELLVKPDEDGKATIRDAQGNEREIDVKADEPVALAPGETYVGAQDGLSDPAMRGGNAVLKTVNGIDAKVAQDGAVDLSINPNVSGVGAVKAVAGQVAIGGWKNRVWNRGLNAKGDRGWNNIFEQTRQRGGPVRRWP